MINSIRRQQWLARALWLFVLLAGLISFAGAQSLQISAYFDDNINGQRDVGEMTIPNVEFLVAGPSFYGPLKTNDAGIAQSSTLEPGNYQILAPTHQPGNLVSTSPIGVIGTEILPGPPKLVEIGFHQECVKMRVKKILWNIGPNGLPNGQATVTFEVSNANAWPIGWVYFDAPPGVTVTPSPLQLNTPIPGGGSGTFSVNVQGLTPNSDICMTLTFHSPDLAFCCAERICFKIPDCDCYQELESIVECNPDGSYSASLVLQNLTAFNVTQVWAVGLNGVNVSPTVTPVMMGPGGTVQLNLTINGQNIDGQMIYVNIMFFSGGTRCCVKPICIQLPNCLQCDDREAICYARRPVYAASSNPGTPSYNGVEWSRFNNKSVVAVTCYASWTVDDPNSAMPDDVVFGYMNTDQYQCMPPALGTDWALNPRAFHNGIDTNRPNVPADAQWTKKYMGNVFAITFDNQGNAYVAQTSAYNADYAPLIQDFNSPGTAGRNHVASPNEIADRRLHGRIFKIENITGKVTIFNEDTTSQWNGLPSGPDPAIISYGNFLPAQRPEVEFSSQAYPEVGDVTFDYDNNQIFATSMDDGKLYRFNMAGQKLNAFDPWAADTGATHGDGFARWGEAIWACKYHRGRVYFSRWNEDFSRFDQPGMTQNEVYSVAINSTNGDFVAGSLRHELSTPNNGQITATAPISDISFMNMPSSAGAGARAHMLLAERGMGSYWINPGNNVTPQYEGMWWHAKPVNPAVPVDAFTNTYPHRSRGLEYACNPDTRQWAEVSNPVIGPYHINLGQSSQSNSAGGVDHDFDDRGCSGGNLGNRNWFTSDYMPSGTGFWYGVQGVPLAGGAQSNSIVIDLDGVSTTSAKTTFGDVEVPCRQQGDFGGFIRLPHYEGPSEGRFVRAHLRIGNTVLQAIGVADETGYVWFDGNFPPGTYEAVLETPSHLAVATTVTVLEEGGMFADLYPTPGDVNCDNEVGPDDFAELAAAFGSSAGDPHYVFFADINGDGEVGPTDFALLAANFGRSGAPIP